MSLYETLLFFHVLGAFALVAGTTAMAPFAFGWGMAALERIGAAQLAMLGSILSGVGAVLTLVLGLWLVGKADYSFFRFWILGALVLWAIAGYSNGQVAGAARESRCIPTFRFTRWSALSTVLVSHSSRSATSS